MPSAPMRLCRKCKAKTHNTYCDACIEKKNKLEWKIRNDMDDRLPASQRGYGTIWTKTRGLMIRRKPLCEICKTAHSQVIHHIDHNQFNNRESNLQALCRICHERIHGRGKGGYLKDC